MHLRRPVGESERTLRRFYDSASVLMGTVELNAGDIIHISDNLAAATFFGTTPEALQGKTARALGVPEAYLSLWLAAYRASVASDGPVRFDYEHEGKGWLKVTVNYIGLSGGRQRFLYVVDDISDLKASESALQEAHDLLEARVAARTAELEAANYRLQHDAFHDALTHLPNRLLFTNRLGHALARYHRDPKHAFSVLFLDLDHFKVVNDSLGHAAGDVLLVGVAERLLACMREEDTVARFGGDEFTVLLAHHDAAHAVEVAERLRAVLAVPFKVGERSFTFGVSVGVVFCETDHREPYDLLRDADLAMYRAKAHRSGRHEVFDSAMRQNALRRLELEADLRVALEQGALEVFFQPITRLHDLSLSGFEALVRWSHPKYGLLTPTAFIPIAEETGLIVKLDRFVLREACAQLGRWHAEPGFPELTINVNVSSQQFIDPGLIEEVGRALLKNNLSPRHLNLELTESLLMQPTAPVAAVVEQLAALGVGLCLDDFGTGYASLSYLQRFPAHVLKIDRSFVRDLGKHDKGTSLVGAVSTMAQTLGLHIVAEGVETAVQLEHLKELGCKYAQGYLFAAPLTAAQAGAFLKKPMSTDIHRG